MVLDGYQFFAGEILPVLADGMNIAINNYDDTEDPSWLSANVAIATVKVRLNKQAMEEEFREPEHIKKGSPLWSEIDAVLMPVAGYPSIRDAVSRLPRDTGPLAAAPAWVRPGIVAGGVAVVAALGYWWARR